MRVTLLSQRLQAVTRPLSEMPDLVALADPQNPLVWVRGDRGCVGVGELLRLEFGGETRFADASDAWRALAARATIDDQVGLPGTGLIALGTFAFADESSATSVLIVPRLVVARHCDAAWITEISLVEAADGAGESTAERAGERTTSESFVSRFPKAMPAGDWAGFDLLGAAAEAAATEAEGSDTTAYLSGVREATRRIEGGDVDKVVLARQIVGHVSASADLRVPLGRLADGYLDCWTFAVDGMIGASPETLVRSTDGAISARVLAGTRARQLSDPAGDARARDGLLTSDKDQHEHAFAVQSVVTALSPHLPDLHTSEEPFALQLPNVWHLATDLGATLGDDGDTNAIDLVGALHPTAAVAGTPTRQAVQLIAELEPFDRGRYAGAVGWIDAQGDGEWVIALRCAQIDESSAGLRSVTATAGGGIVSGSDAERELAETVSKFRPIAGAVR